MEFSCGGYLQDDPSKGHLPLYSYYKDEKVFLGVYLLLNGNNTAVLGNQQLNQFKKQHHFSTIIFWYIARYEKRETYNP